MPTQVITIPILEDLIVEDTESFTVSLTTNDTAVTLRLQTAAVSIRDNDSKLQLLICTMLVEILLVFFDSPFSGITIGFNQTAYSVNEGAGSVNTTVSILDGTLDRNVFVTVFTSDATASSAGG